MAVATASASLKERTGVVTFKGNPLTLVGSEVRVGQKAPDFQVLAQDLSPVTLGSSRGKTRLISVVPSLDTPVCDAQTRRFNQEAATLPNIAILTISADLPFAQKRWCGAAGVDKVQVLSDHKDVSFGTAYGVLIKELRLLSRSIFIIDAGDTVRYVEYVPEVTSHPNYDAALQAAAQAAK
jgi:thiol peroxidase